MPRKPIFRAAVRQRLAKAMRKNIATAFNTEVHCQRADHDPRDWLVCPEGNRVETRFGLAYVGLTVSPSLIYLAIRFDEDRPGVRDLPGINPHSLKWNLALAPTWGAHEGECSELLAGHLMARLSKLTKA